MERIVRVDVGWHEGYICADAEAWPRDKAGVGVRRKLLFDLTVFADPQACFELNAIMAMREALRLAGYSFDEGFLKEGVEVSNATAT